MFRCVFVTPVAKLQQQQQQQLLSETSEGGGLKYPHFERATSSIIPFEIDPSHQRNVLHVMEGDKCVVKFDCAQPGYFIGQTPLTTGRYRWKVCSV